MGSPGRLATMPVGQGEMFPHATLLLLRFNFTQQNAYPDTHVQQSAVRKKLIKLFDAIQIIQLKRVILLYFNRITFIMN